MAEYFLPLQFVPSCCWKASANRKDILFFRFSYSLFLHSPDKVERHKVFIRALRSTGVIEVLARFKPKEIFCNHCKNIIKRHEEKESDVAMASKMLEVFSKTSAILSCL